MRGYTTLVLVVLGVYACYTGMAQESNGQQRKPAAKQEAKQPSNQDSDEAAIRANVDAFAKAYNKGDAKAIAALFGENAQIIDEDNHTVQGRDAIAQVFADIFEETPKTHIEVMVDSIKFVGTALAIEAGRTRVDPGPGEEPEQSQYTVVHVKQDGKWVMALARDTAGEALSNQDRLKPLEFLVGEWVNEGGDAVVSTTCRWDESKNYVLQDIRVRMEGREAMTVNQRFGWDPLTKQIKSWVFDSEGGYGETLWVHDGDRWIGKATGVRSDGSTASATNVVMPVSRDRYVWSSSDRIVAGEVEDPVEIEVVRRPPNPAQAGASK